MANRVLKNQNEKLSKVKCKKFYITDTDDSQLLQMIAYKNSTNREHFSQTIDFTGFRQIL